MSQEPQLKELLVRFLEAYENSYEEAEIHYLSELKNAINNLAIRIKLGNTQNNKALTDQIYEINAKIPLEKYNGNTVFQLAVNKNHQKVVEWLRDYNDKLPINMESINNSNQTALHIAIQNKNLSIVYLLIKADVNLHAKIIVDEKELSYIEYARHCKADTIANYLEKALNIQESAIFIEDNDIHATHPNKKRKLGKKTDDKSSSDDYAILAAQRRYADYQQEQIANSPMGGMLLNSSINKSSFYSSPSSTSMGLSPPLTTNTPTPTTPTPWHQGHPDAFPPIAPLPSTTHTPTYVVPSTPGSGM
jgi:hypothetical protein